MGGKFYDLAILGKIKRLLVKEVEGIANQAIHFGKRVYLENICYQRYGVGELQDSPNVLDCQLT